MGYDASLEIVGVRPPDDEWRKMKAIWDSCESADIEPPKEVRNYFGDDGPHEEGICVGVEKEVVSEGHEFMTTGVRDGATGDYYLVELAKLPKNITHLKVWIHESY